MLSDDPPLVGRDAELSIVRAFLSGSGRHGGALVIRGPRGVGKSAVLQSAVAEVGTAGVLVLPASGVGHARRVPFGVLNQMLRPVRPSIDELSRSQRAALTVALGFGEAPETPVSDVAEAVTSLLLRVSERNRVLLVVDDWHLVDDPSAAVLAQVSRRVSGAQIGLLVTDAGEDGVPRCLPGSPILEVKPLDPVAAAELLRTRFPDLARDVSACIAAEAHGYPLALVDWPDALTDDERSGRLPLPVPLPLGPRLRATFAPAIRDLPPSSRPPLLMAAITEAGDRLDVRGSFGAALAPARRAGLISVDPETQGPLLPHPLVRATVLALSTSAERRDAHRSLLRHARTRGSWARHVAASVVEPDRMVAQMIEDAGHQSLRRGDVATGVASLVRSADLSARPSDRSRRLALAALAVARSSGQLRAAADLLHEARRADPALHPALAESVATAYVAFQAEGEVEVTHELVREAVIRCRSTADAPEHGLVEALQSLTDMRALGGRTARLAAPLHGEGAELEGRQRSLLCRVLVGDVSAHGPVRGCVAGVSALDALALEATHCVTTGRWDVAEQRCSSGLEMSRASGHELLRQHFDLCRAEIAAVRGDVGRAREIALQVDAWVEPRCLGALQARSSFVRALAASAEGDFELAYRSAVEISPAGIVTPQVPVSWWAALTLVESAVRTNRPHEALAHAEAMRASGVAALSPGLAMVVGAMSGLTAPHGRVRAEFEEALSGQGLEQWPFELARVRLAYGERLRRMRARGEARPHLQAALDGFERLSAHPWAARARTELNATGGTATTATEETLDALTPQEREVAMLAASGLTNGRIAERLFCSPRTVGAHLRQVFSKLGVSSRASLGDALGRAA